jgi:PRTRC genetic system protein A
MPYGRVGQCTELAFGRISDVLGVIQDFIANARHAAPSETADMLVWDSRRKALTDDNVTVLDKSTGSVRYELRELDDHESVAIDMHSHGHIPAFFSDTDDRDDAGSVKISGVVGNLDSDTPTAAFRLCVLGLYLPINVPADRIFGSAA